MNTHKRNEIHTRVPEAHFNALMGFIGADGLGELETLSDVVRCAIAQFIHNNSKAGTDQIMLNAELQHKILQLASEVQNYETSVNRLELEYNEKKLVLIQAEVNIKAQQELIESLKLKNETLEQELVQARNNFETQRKQMLARIEYHKQQTSKTNVDELELKKSAPIINILEDEDTEFFFD